MKKIIILINIFFLMSLCVLSFNLKKIEAKELKEPTCYQQNDPRWGSHVNGDGTIASSACGILSTVNCVNYLTGNFINPVELADYAHDIGAYNIPEGGGTWRFLLYKDLKPFEDKYGFTVDLVSSDGVTITDTRLVKHLKNGGVAIGYVPGHFIAIVGYDEEEQLYEIYDSAANVSKRHTYTRGTWLTVDELSESGNPNMAVSWFCLISKKDITSATHYDGTDGLYTNGKDEQDITVYKGSGFKTSFPVSGYAFDSRGVTDYYYTIDYLNYGPSNMYSLEPVKNEVGLNKNGDSFTLVDDRLSGFIGEVDLENASVGMHYIQIYAKTAGDGLRSVASIRANVVDSETANDVINVTNIITDLTSVYRVSALESVNNLKGLYILENYAMLKVKFTEDVSGFKADLYYGDIYYTSGIISADNSMLFRINPNVTSDLVIKANQNIEVSNIYIFVGDDYKYYSEGNDSCLAINKISDDGIVERGEVSHLLYTDFVDSTCLEDGHDIKYCLYCAKSISSDVVNKKGHVEKDIYYNDEEHYKMCDVCHEFYDYEEHSFEYGTNKVYHWLICECGLKKDVEEHVFDEETHLCKCGYLDPNLCYHEHTTVLEKVDPTYESEGLTEGLICDDCGKVLTEQTVIPKLEQSTVDKTNKKGCKKDVLEVLITNLSISFVVVALLKRKKK